jgi:hypothetical protein
MTPRSPLTRRALGLQDLVHCERRRVFNRAESVEDLPSIARE